MSRNQLPLLAERVIGRPLLIAPSMSEVLLSVLHGRVEGLAGDASLSPASPDASQLIGSRRRSGGGVALTRKAGSTALISVIGGLVNRGAWIDANFCTGLTSYEGIAAQVREAAGDAEIKNIILDIDSPGGEATGMFALAAAIRQARKSKYVVAVVNDLAASAAYGIASAADEIVISPTSIVGSIGIVMMHVDRSGELAAKGIRPTLIHAGAHKVDGHPFGPLPEAVRAAMQRDTMAMYDRFLETVEAGRGPRLSAKAARATEARTFIGRDAIAAGLADRFGTVEEVLAELSAKKPPPSRQKGKTTMHPYEVNSEAIAQAKAEERARIKAIITSPEAQGRQNAALHLAFSSDMEPDAVRGTLNGLPFDKFSSSVPAPSAEDGTGFGANGRPDYGPGSLSDQEQIAASWKDAFGSNR